MALKSRNYIWSGAIGGFFIGKTIAGMFFGEVYFELITPQHIIVIVASIAFGAFIGHVLRH